MDGFLVICKPKGMTSHDMVNKTRRKLSIKKVGHTGTLDPMATGVLILCIGKGTRFSQYLMGGKKKYEAEIIFGINTNTLDMDGDILYETSSLHIETNNIKEALETFKGSIMQIPPMVSAIKKDGVALYKLARKGIEIDREPRTVNIYNIELLNSRIVSDKRIVNITVTCSAGTYVRSLCEDLGKKLGICATLSKLHRSQNGIFSENDSLPYEDFEKMDADAIKDKILPLETGINYLPTINLEESKEEDIACGREILLSESEIKRVLENKESLEKENEIVTETSKITCLALINSQSTAIGILEGNIFKPKKVFI